MNYDLQNSGRGIRECPKCKFTMEPLRRSAFLARSEGYMLDASSDWDPDNHVVTSFLFGSLSRFLWRHFLEPISHKLFGEWRSRSRQRILGEFPESLICPHCQYILKRK